MGRFETRHWTPNPNAMGPRRARAGGSYRVFPIRWRAGRWL